MKKINIVLVSGIWFLVTLICPGCSNANIDKPAQSGELVYLKAASGTASSFEDTPDWAPKPDPMAPVDGDLETRWSPASGIDNEWIYFDLGREKTLSKIIIRWEEAYATAYEISVSDDAVNWKRVVLKKDGKGGVEDLAFDPVRARYVKITGLARFNPEWGFSMWEFEMYGPGAMNPGDRTLDETFPKRAEARRKAQDTPAVNVSDDVLVPSPGPITKEEFQKGVNYTSWNRDELAGKVSDSTLLYLAGLGVKHVAIMVVWYQADAEAKDIFRDDSKTISDEALRHAVNVCHSLGMKVMLKSHVDLEDGEFRTNILPSEEWFDSYKRFILRYAEFSAKNNVEIFSIGTELANTTIVTWQKRWSDIIGEVRRLYNGPIIYGANWDEYETVSFWPEVDYIGIDAYFPLTDKTDPTKEELVEAWKARGDEIEEYFNAKGLTGKPVIFTEVGYDAIDGSNMQPWRVLPTLADQKEDQKEQSDCLDAMMLALSGRSWFKGLYWWNYFPRPDLGPLGYTLRGKEGEKVLVDWFKKVK